jgi:hypothetical protein
MRLSHTPSAFRAYGALLGLLTGLGATAVGAAPRTTFWKVTLAADLRSDEVLAGGLVQKNGDLIAQVNAAYGKPQAPSSTETRFVRFRNGGITWLSRTPQVPGGLLAEAPGGGWYTVSTQPSVQASNADLLVRCRNTSGQLLWSAQWDDPQHHPDQPHAVAADAAGNLLIAGEADGYPAVWKYNPQGALLWSATSSSGPGVFTHVAVASDGAVSVAGTLTQNAGDFLVAHYTAAGAELWSHVNPDQGQHSEQVTALQLFPNGDVCVTGPSHTLIETGVLLTLRYRTDGELLWSRPYWDPDLVGLTPTGLAVDDYNYTYVYATGWTDNQPSTVLIKYDPQSEPEWFVTRPYVQGLGLPGGDLRLDSLRYLHLSGRGTRRGRPVILATYNVKGQSVRAVNLKVNTDPQLVDLDPQRNVLLLANPWAGKARKHDVLTAAIPAYTPR